GEDERPARSGPPEGSHHRFRITRCNPHVRWSMRTLYLDCPSGISGDMFLAALVDLGASEAYIRDGLKRLSLSEEWDLQFERVTRRSLAATYARVTVAAKPADAPWSGPEP